MHATRDRTRMYGCMHVSCNKYHVSCIMYHVSCIMYHVSCIMYPCVRWLPIPRCTIHVLVRIVTGTVPSTYIFVLYIHNLFQLPTVNLTFSNMPPPPSIVFVVQSPLDHRTSPPSFAPSTWSTLSKSNTWLASIHRGSRRPRLSVSWWCPDLNHFKKMIPHIKCLRFVSERNDYTFSAGKSWEMLSHGSTTRL